MTDRGILNSRTTIIRQTAVRVVLGSAACAIVIGAAFWLSGRWTALAAPTTLTLTAHDALAWQDEQGKSAALIAGYEGSFDPISQRLVIQGGGDITRRATGGRALQGRVNPNQEVPRNTAYTFTIVNSTFLSSGDQAGNISGEIRLNNQSGATLYNTRLIFTRFNLCPPTGGCDGATAQTPAGTMPGATGFAYYNDGLIPYQNKLHVSRAYGDIPPSGNSSAVWTFNVSTTPARFFFAFVVLADWGVAAESVYPAAVQVNASAGANVLIRGRGFTGSPTVSLLNASGAVVTNLSNVAVTNDTQITATVPAGTAAGIYSVRVTLAGGTAGGQNSSVIRDRLTVTAVPTATLSGAVSSLASAGPFLVTGDVTLTNVTVPPGTVFYVNNNVRVSVAAATALSANGGVPGVPTGAGIAIPSQIVFTAQRSPGAGLPSAGAWAGLDMTSTGQSAVLRNVVVEFGGASNSAGVNFTNSGRTVQFTDSIARFSAGSGIAANGTNDSLVGFTRNRIEYNGLSAATPALLLSGNAALGLYELPGNNIPTSTNVGDASYFYAGANDFTGNSLDAIQIGTDGDQAANDFTRSGVLVGQGTTPIHLRGSNANPAIVGTVPPAAAPEVTINPGALIQLAAGLDFQAGDYSTSRRGCIAANGFAGVNQVPGASLTSSRFIVFDRIGAGGNFGSIFFARNSLTSCLLAFVQVRNGGASVRGNGAVISEGASLVMRNTQVTNSSTGGIVELQGGLLAGTGTTTSNNAQLIIDTIAGGLFGEGNLASEATVLSPLFVATDTQGRGIFFVDGSVSVPVIRFVNTTRNPVVIAGQTIPAGTIRTLAGGGLDLQDNFPGLSTDLGIVTGLAVSNTGEAVYFIDSITPAIRFLNIAAGSITLGGQTINSGRVGTLAAGGNLGATVVALAVHPTNGDVYFCDAANNNNRVYRVAAAGGSPVLVAGSGGNTVGDAAFEGDGSVATSIKLLDPRAVTVDSNGNVYIADTGHNRVIRVSGNSSFLLVQFPNVRTPPVGSPYKNRPFPSGLALANGQLYIALRSAHNIVRVDGSQNPPDIAGLREVSCEYTNDNCGDGGPAKGTAGASPSGGRFKFLDAGTIGVAGDANGLFICDQPGTQGLRGRIRYVNITNNPVEVAGKTINGNNVDTVFGTGLNKPFDTGLANAALLSSPAGVGVEPGTGNIWIAESGNLRYINRTPKPLTIFPGTASAATVQPGRIVTANSQAGLGSSTDNVDITFGGFDTAQGIWVTSQGVYLADARGGPGLQGTNTNLVNRRTSRIRFINTSNQTVDFYQSGVNPISVPPGIVKTIVGGNPDAVRSAEDGPDPLAARLVGALDVAIAPNGDIYFCEAGNKRVRRVNRTNGIVTSIPSTILPGATDPGVTNSAVNAYSGLTFDNQGRLLVADAGANAILREKAAGSAFTTGFDTLLAGAPLISPRDVVVDSTGAFAYVTNAGPLFPAAGDHRVLRLTLSGNTATAATFAGQQGVKGYVGDYGPPLSAQLNLQASGIVITVQGGTGVLSVVPTLNITTGLNGEIIFADSANNAIRRIR
jgi:hypothetical protein